MRPPFRLGSWSQLVILALVWPVWCPLLPFQLAADRVRRILDNFTA